MTNPYILHMITPQKHMSPFDVNMALDAGWNAVIPYAGVILDEVRPLVQDAIFSRSPNDGPRTGLFIGGKNAIQALDMIEEAASRHGAALRAVDLRRSGWLLHHCRRHGGLRREAAHGQVRPHPQGLGHRRLRRHRRRVVLLGRHRRAPGRQGQAGGL